mgnify:CR=1 FL=1|jgi:hypothetical protein
MIEFIILNLILPLLLGILSSWIYDSIKEKRYQNAILLIIEDREMRSSFHFSHPNNLITSSEGISSFVA